MWRYVLILFFLIGVTPFLPGLVESRLGALGVGNGTDADNAAASRAEADGPKVHRISVNRQGHYVADAYLNGRAVDMLVDTGATVMALPESLAEDIGIFLKSSDYKHPVGTANGTAYAARTIVDNLRIGNIRLRNIDAIVLKDDSLGAPLLGMSVLGRLKRFDISSGTLILVQ